MTTLKFGCPMCSQNLETDFDMIGQSIQCPKCQKVIRIPFPPSPPMVPSAPPTTSACAIVSLVLSILSLFCFGFLTGIPGVICGHIGISNIKRSGGRMTGQGLCVAGLIIGYISIAFWLIWVLFFGGLAFLVALAE